MTDQRLQHLLYLQAKMQEVYSFIQELSLQQHNHVTDSVAVKHLNFEPPSSSGNKIKFKEFWDAFEATCPQEPKDLHN